MKKSSSDFSFLQGNGEVVELIRSYNWSASSLGSPDQWPQSLRTAVSIVVHSKFPMTLFWGPDYILFYNDAFRPGLGNQGKHPAIGKKACDVLTENWPLIKSILDKILTGGESSWLEEQLRPVYRNGKTENVYWTFSHSAVIDERGRPAGVLAIGSETTDKVDTIQKLRVSNERFENLVREATVGIIVLIGENMIVEVVNDAYGQLIDREVKEIIGRPLFDIIPEAIDPFLSILQNVRMTGNPLYLYDQPYFIYANGIKKEGYLNIVYMPFKESDGKITGVMALCHDVTQQVIARKKTEEAEERTRLSIKAAELGIFEVHLPTNEVSVSDRFSEIFGVDKNSERNDFVNAIHPDDRQRRKEANQIALKTGLLEYEARIILPHGNIRWIRATGTVYYDEKKIPIRLLGVVQDITERKENERLLQEAAENLSIALNAGQLGSYEYMVETGVINCNSQCKSNFGFAPNEDLTFEKLLSVIHPEDRTSMQQAVGSAFTNHTLYSTEYRITLPNKSTRWIRASGRGLYNQLNQPVKMVGVTVDITEQKNFENELSQKVEERTKELKAINSELEQFAYAASHDLQEPLRKVTTFTNLLQERNGEQLSESGKNYIAKIDHSVNRMKMIIDDLLQYSYHTKTDQLATRVDLNQIIDSIETDLELLIQEKNATLIKDNLPSLIAIAPQMTQLFQNIISNSLKFSKKDIPSHITITTHYLSEKETSKAQKS